MIETFDDSPVKGKKKPPRKLKSKSVISNESDAYTASPIGSENGSDNDASVVANPLPKLTGQSSPIHETTEWTIVDPSVSNSSADNIAGPSNTGAQYRDATPLSPIHNSYDEMDTEDLVCSLCGVNHEDGACYMTESSENLAEYRRILILHGEDEPMETRVCFVLIFMSYS